MVSVETIEGKERVVYTRGERDKALLYYVTSTTDNIYAFNHNLPPEVFGAFTAFFSRNPLDPREHLFNAIIGNVPGHELPTKQGAENLQKLVNEEYKSPSEALSAGISKAKKFFETWYGKYSHKSIGNVVKIPIVMTGITQLVARQVACDQLAFFIEQSTRFVKYDTGEYYKPKEIMKSEFADTYTSAIEALAKAYLKLLEFGKNYYQKQLPFREWMKLQTEETKLKSEKFQRRKYEREIDGKVFDDIRFLLPQAIMTNLSVMFDARSLEYNIAAWKGHPLEEVRKTATLLEKHGKKVAPSLFISVEANSYYSDKYYGYNGAFIVDESVKQVKKHVNIIDPDPALLDKVVAFVLKGSNKGLFAPYLERARQMAFEEKLKFIERLAEKRRVSDEWLDVAATLDLPKITVEIVTDVGALRDLRRHQKPDRDESRYTLDLGYTIPPAIENGYGQEAKQIFVAAMEKAHEAEKKLRNKFPHQAQYVIPMACNHSLLMSLGVDQLQYFINLRSTPQGNWSYRQDMFNLAEQVLRIYPWLVGYKEYPEGKSVFEVYEQAPFIQKLTKAVAKWEQRKADAKAKGEEFTEKMPHPSPFRLRTGPTELHE